MYRQSELSRTSRIAIGFIATAIAGSPLPAAACGYCVWAQVDYVFPAITAWWWIGCAWLVAEGAITTATQPYRVLQLNLPNALILFFIFYLLAMGVFGPLPLLFMFTHTAKKFVSELRQWRQDRSRASRLYIAIGAVALLALFSSYGLAQARAAHRTRVDHILKWPDTASARQLMNRIVEDKSTGNAELAELMSRSKNAYSIWKVVSTAARSHVPPQDLMPHALAAYRRVYKADDHDWLSSLQAEMELFSHLDLPDRATPDQWEAAWRDRSTTAAQQVH